MIFTLKQKLINYYLNSEKNLKFKNSANSSEGKNTVQ